jgi:putative alpha-1,2-mannosidase
VSLGAGKKLEINAPNYSKENIYIQRMTLNGKEYHSNTQNHFDLVSGAKIDFEMGNQPKR